MSVQRAPLGAVAVDSGQSGMKHLVMSRPKEPTHPPSALPPRGAERRPEAAFDLWLQRSLHQLFDDVAKEPIPDDLMRLIEQNRKQ